MLIAVRVVVFFLGAWVVGGTLLSSVRAFVLPRSSSDFMLRSVFRATRLAFELALVRARGYAERDRALALYAPITLMALPAVWLASVEVGYTAMYWSLGVGSLRDALTVSGSSLLTLGFAPVTELPLVALAFSEAAVGLVLVALLIAYLPTMYSAFSKRELAVAMLEVRAGSPPFAVELFSRYYRIGNMGSLTELWATWEVWFAEVEESHTSLPALNFFRSPQPDRHWTVAAGAVLDSAALFLAAVDAPRDARAALCIRGGYVALRRIASYFGVPFDPSPRPDDPIFIMREEFEGALDQLAAAGVPLKPDRDQAWRDFVGWRVNYEAPLLGLCSVLSAPEAPWTSDRAPRRRRLPRLRRH